MRGGRVGGRLILAVGLDGLAQQRDLSDAPRDVRLDLAHDLRDGAAALAPAAQRHDAVGAELVAALDDGHVGGDRGRARVGQPTIGQNRGPELAAEVVRAQRVVRQVEHPDHVVEALRLGEGVDVGEARPQGVVPGADHAAHDGDLEVGVALLERAQVGELGGRPVLGVLPHGAGVDHDQVGVGGAVGGLPAQTPQAGAEAGAVGDVHLTADGPDVVGLHRCSGGRRAGESVPGVAGPRWRRVRDSNPRSSFPETRLAGGRTRPLCEPSIGRCYQPPRSAGMHHDTRRRRSRPYHWRRPHPSGARAGRPAEEERDGASRASGAHAAGAAARRGLRRRRRPR